MKLPEVFKKAAPNMGPMKPQNVAAGLIVIGLFGWYLVKYGPTLSQTVFLCLVGAILILVLVIVLPEAGIKLIGMIGYIPGILGGAAGLVGKGLSAVTKMSKKKGSAD